MWTLPFSVVSGLFYMYSMMNEDGLLNRIATADIVVLVFATTLGGERLGKGVRDEGRGPLAFGCALRGAAWTACRVGAPRPTLLCAGPSLPLGISLLDGRPLFHPPPPQP